MNRETEANPFKEFYLIYSSGFCGLCAYHFSIHQSSYDYRSFTMDWPYHTASSLVMPGLNWDIDGCVNLNQACTLQTPLLQTENPFSNSTNDDPSVGDFLEYPNAQIHTDPVELSPWYQLDFQEFGQYTANLPSSQPRAIGARYIDTENITEPTYPGQNAPIHEARVSTGCTGTHTEWQIGSDNQLKRQKQQAYVRTVLRPIYSQVQVSLVTNTSS